MNPKIKELIEQATSIEHGVDNGFDMVIFDKEKFAELIVRECVVVLDEKDGSEHHSCLLEHFGVEE